MGSPFRSEFDARVLIADRERELRRAEGRAWGEHPIPKPERSRTIRRTVGAWVIRAGERIGGGSVAPTWDTPGGTGQG